MADESFQEVLTAAGFVITPASPDFLAWLEARKVSPPIIDLLAEGLPEPRKKRRFRWLDRWDFWAEQEIQEDTEEYPRHLKAGLLPIGSCVNGDPIALNLRKPIGSVGFISHDKVWRNDDVRIRDYFVVVTRSLGEFARQARDGLLPIDYYQAKGLA
jgi:hypothetical protein